MADEEKNEITEQTEPTEQGAPAEPEKPEADELKDKHGQEAVAKGKYQRDIAERDKRIAELEAKVEEAAKTEKGRADLKAEFEAFKVETAKREQAHELSAAGCIDVEAAQALIGEMTVAQLKESKPYLFETVKKGATGIKPAGAADDAKTAQQKADEALGFKPRKK